MDPEIQQQLESALMLRAELYTTEKAIKSQVEECKANMESLLAKAGLKTIKHETYGAATWTESSRSSLNKDKLKESLFKQGVDTDIITRAIGEATTTSHSAYVKYTPVKSK